MKPGRRSLSPGTVLSNRSCSAWSLLGGKSSKEIIGLGFRYSSQICTGSFLRLGLLYAAHPWMVRVHHARRYGVKANSARITDVPAPESGARGKKDVQTST